MTPLNLLQSLSLLYLVILSGHDVSAAAPATCPSEKYMTISRACASEVAGTPSYLARYMSIILFFNYNITTSAIAANAGVCIAEALGAFQIYTLPLFRYMLQAYQFGPLDGGPAQPGDTEREEELAENLREYYLLSNVLAIPPPDCHTRIFPNPFTKKYTVRHTQYTMRDMGFPLAQRQTVALCIYSAIAEEFYYQQSLQATA